MAIYDYTDQLDEDVNIADPNPGNEVSYEYKLVDSIGKEPDQSLIYYTKNSSEEYVKCPVVYEEVDTSIPPSSGESYYRFTDKTGYVFVGQLTSFDVGTSENPIRYFIKADLVFDPRVKYYIKVRKPITFTPRSKFEDVASNHRYLEDFASAIYSDSVGEVLNRHVFRFTKLREDIIFIKVRLTKQGSSLKGQTLTLVVNERSFWNRLYFYKANEPTSRYLPIDKVDPYDLLLASLRNSKDISRITLRLINDEMDRIQTIYDSYSEDREAQEKITSYNIAHNANVEITGFEHYSKRLWLAYFESIYNSEDSKVISSEDKARLGILDFKDRENIAFFNPNDPEYSSYSLFYQGQ